MPATKPTFLAIIFVVFAPHSYADTFPEILSDYFEPLSAAQLDLSDPTLVAQIELGKTLYFDTRLSADWDLSCATCHDIFNGGDDGLALSVGHQGQLAERNAPTVLNAVFNRAHFWDGRAATLADQAKDMIQSPAEMASTPKQTLATLNAIPWYRDQFQAAFPDQSEPLTFDNLALAIEAFETTLITPSPFDQFLTGKPSILDPDALFGAFTFLDTGCIVCHNGINIGGGFFERFGAANALDPNVFSSSDQGRFRVTQNEKDKSVFKVASLRNVTLTGPYFHNGRVDALDEAINIMAQSQLGSTLSQADTQSIIAFLTSLEGQPLDIEVPNMPELDPILGPLPAPKNWVMPSPVSLPERNEDGAETISTDDIQTEPKQTAPFEPVIQTEPDAIAPIEILPALPEPRQERGF